MSAFLNTGADKSGVTIVGNKVICAANTAREGFTFQNTSDTDMWLTENGSAAAVGTGYKIGPGVGFTASTGNAINLYCAAASKTFAATEA